MAGSWPVEALSARWLPDPPGSWMVTSRCAIAGEIPTGRQDIVTFRKAVIDAEKNM
jgi:hypothetical protein